MNESPNSEFSEKEMVSMYFMHFVHCELATFFILQLFSTEIALFIKTCVPNYIKNKLFRMQHWRTLALDYSERFVGHCNTTTDIKEANFFGSDGKFVIAG